MKSLAECEEPLFIPHHHCKHIIGTSLIFVRENSVSQRPEHASCDARTCQRLCNHLGGKEQPLKHKAGCIETWSDFTADSGSRQSRRNAFHQVPPAYNVSSCRSNATAWVLDEGPGSDIRSYFRRLDCLCKLAVAVVYHYDYIIIPCLHCLCDFRDRLA